MFQKRHKIKNVFRTHWLKFLATSTFVFRKLRACRKKWKLLVLNENGLSCFSLSCYVNTCTCVPSLYF